MAEPPNPVNTACEITNLPDAVAIEGRKGLIFTVTGKTSNNQPLEFKSSWDPEEAAQYFKLHPEHDELHVHVESDPMFTCNSVTLTVTVNDGMSDSRPANLEIFESELRAILIGKTGVGKSAVGNSILNLSPDTRFLSKARAASVTRHNLCKHGVREVAGVKYLFKILDTPGLSDTQVSHQEVAMELAKSIYDLTPGPHIFCFVLSVDRIDEHIMDIIQQYKDLFGECLKTYGVIIFTKKDSLEETSFTEYLEDVKPEFKEFLEDYCDNRHSLINNKNPQSDVQGILSLMLETKRNNNGDHYRNVMFEEARKLYGEKLKKIEDEKTKVERELKQQLELQEQQLELKDENEKKLKQQLKLKEENEKKFDEKEKKLKQQLELQERDYEQQQLKLKEEIDEKNNMLQKLQQIEDEKTKVEQENKELKEQVRGYKELENKSQHMEIEFPEDNMQVQKLQDENRTLPADRMQVQNLKDKSPKLLDKLNKQKPSDQETDVNSVTDSQPQIAEVDISKKTVGIRNVELETLSNPSTQKQIAEVEKLRHTVNIQNIDFVKLCNLLLQDGYLNKKDKEDIVSSETSINTMDALMDILKKTNNNKAYIIVINHLKSGTSMETTSTTQGNFPKHVVILRTHSGCLRTTLADQIESVARNLNARFVVHDYQLKNILEKAKNLPEDAVSDLIDIMKDSKKNFDAFIQCLNDMGYTGLVEKLTDDPTHETMVQADQSDGIKTDNENKVKTDIEVVAKPNITDSSQTFLLEKDENQKLLEEHNKKKPSDQETDVNSVTNPQPQIAEVENSKQTADIRSEDFETLSNPSGQEIDLKTATVSQPQIAEVEKLRHTVNIQNVDFVKLCNLLLQDGYLNEKDKEDIVSSESPINTMDTLMDMLTKENNSKAYTIVINHLKSGTSMETTSSTQDTDDTYDHLLIDEENKGMTIPDDKTTYNNTMDVVSICDTCEYGTLDDVNNLILHNKDFNIRGRRGRTPLYHCVMSPRQPVEKVKLLVSTGAMVDVKDKYGHSLLHWACRWSTIDCIKYLLEQGLDKEGRDKHNRTPLFHCVWSDDQQVEKVKLLVSTGAMLDVKDDRGRSLLDFAREWDRECETYLRELGLDK